jgi:hypothetical protein
MENFANMCKNAHIFILFSQLMFYHIGAICCRYKNQFYQVQHFYILGALSVFTSVFPLLNGLAFEAKSWEMRILVFNGARYFVHKSTLTCWNLIFCKNVKCFHQHIDWNRRFRYSLILIDHQIDKTTSHFDRKWGWKADIVEYIWTKIMIKLYLNIDVPINIFMKNITFWHKMRFQQVGVILWTKCLALS